MNVGARERRDSSDATGLDRTHLVVRKDQVRSTPLHVEGHAEVVQSDGRALDVPPGPTVTKVAAGPGRFAGTRGTPQQRVQLIALTRSFGVSPTLGVDRHHLVPIPRGDRAEVRGGREIEVDV